MIGKVNSSHFSSQAPATFHSIHTSAQSALCHLAVIDPWVHSGWANGRRTLAWERAWQKLQHGGADLQCEPPFLGPEEGSS